MSSATKEQEGESVARKCDACGIILGEKSTRWRCEECGNFVICSFCESEYADDKHCDGKHTFTQSTPK